MPKFTVQIFRDVDGKQELLDTSEVTGASLEDASAERRREYARQHPEYRDDLLIARGNPVR